MCVQSTENARRKAENSDSPNPYPPPSSSSNPSPARGANNAGEEYMQQIARNSSDLARRRAEAFAQARLKRENPSNTEIPVQNAARPPPPTVGSEGQRRARLELEKLERETEELQRIILRRQEDAKKLAESNDAEKVQIQAEAEREVDDFSEEKLKRDIAEIEARLASIQQTLKMLGDEMERRISRFMMRFGTSWSVL